MCQKINPSLNIHPHNRRRLENYLNRENHDIVNPELKYDVKFIGLTTSRDTLYNIINQRVTQMFQDGLVKEVEGLVKKYGETNILKRAIGYKEILLYLNGHISLEEAQELIKKNSRHYAKRQYTWFKNQMNIKWFDINLNDFNKTCDEVKKYLENID